ncbi:hypothetical protein BCEN4_850019 [Burkholderia cenocepacia]|nr:hypothetical protein BCEN4_850019 [Burkholderia cenocepacia]
MFIFLWLCVDAKMYFTTIANTATSPLAPAGNYIPFVHSAHTCITRPYQTQCCKAFP